MSRREAPNDGSATVLVMAKAPMPGRVKTRLCPPLRPREAADLAAAALRDTLDAVAAAPCDSRVLALDGAAPRGVPDAFTVVAQKGMTFAERLAHALGAVRGPTLIIGMDTPQIESTLLGHGFAMLSRPGVDAVLGPACDGGWWALGLARPDPDVFRGVPMSTSITGACQRARLTALGLRTRHLPTLRDVDHIDDAIAVADAHPDTRFARALRALKPDHPLPAGTRR